MYNTKKNILQILKFYSEFVVYLNFVEMIEFSIVLPTEKENQDSFQEMTLTGFSKKEWSIAGSLQRRTWEYVVSHFGHRRGTLFLR